MNDIFLFDLEWVEEPRAGDALKSIYKSNRSMPSKAPEKSVAQVVDLFEADIKELQPNEEWLMRCLAVEESGKNRHGIIKCINQELDAIANPVPDKARQMAEAVVPVCMCYAMPDDDFKKINSVIGEAAVASRFCDLCRDLVPCGYAIDFADMPVIMASIARSRANKSLKGSMPRFIDLKRGTGYIDLMKLRFGYNNPCKQRDLAAAMGYKPSRIDPLKDGSQVQAMFDAEDIESIVSHNMLDVEALIFIYKHYRGLIW